MQFLNAVQTSATEHFYHHRLSLRMKALCE